jgi:alkanesulfonate monooxygenase SsuD/methylene tetrahydromethanopterin reductase-like flavin-dependent oxidoreductase (luciferase family)
VKLHDVAGPDYCGRCGKNWPAALAAIPADGLPPPPEGPRPPRLTLVRSPQASERFAARVGDLADRFRSGERFAAQRAASAVVPDLDPVEALTPEATRAALEALVGVRCVR